MRSASHINQLQLLLPEQHAASWLKEGVWLSTLVFTALLPLYLLLPLLLSHSLLYWELWISPEHKAQTAQPKSEPITSPRMSYPSPSTAGAQETALRNRPKHLYSSLTTSAGLHTEKWEKNKQYRISNNIGDTAQTKRFTFRCISVKTSHFPDYSRATSEAVGCHLAVLQKTDTACLATLCMPAKTQPEDRKSTTIRNKLLIIAADPEASLLLAVNHS